MKSIDQLKNIPLFQAVSKEELIHLDKNLRPISLKQGDVIISEGEVGDCLYIIRKGKVKVVAELEKETEQITLSYLAAGDFFGEMSLITGEPRSATVVAESNVELWELSKKDFDTLVANNPNVSLSMTHMLSQRLSLSNKAREGSERYYKHRIAPKGNLADVDLVTLLKYAEENSLTGEIRITFEDKNAQFIYKKGQLSALDFEEKDEDEAMDEILDWHNGEFIIEPSVFKISKEEENPDDILVDSLLVNHFEKYLKDKFKSLVKFAGTRTTQLALNKSFHKFENYFDVTSDVHIQTEPKFFISLHPAEKWSDKHTLFVAVLLRDVMTTLERDLIGTQLWNVRSSEEQIDQVLSELQFYTYYEQAVDFVRE